MNIQGATEKVEKTIDISKYLPEGVSLVDDAAKNVTATATIEEDGTRTVDFMVASIKSGICQIPFRFLMSRMQK